MSFKGIYIKSNLHLFDNQKSNIKQLIHKRRCILSDKCGAGKTVSVLYAFSYLKEKGIVSNLLVLTPLSAYEKKVWKKDIDKFTNLKSIDIDSIADTDVTQERLDKILAHYDVVYGKHTHVKQLYPLKLIQGCINRPSTLFCCDEVHAFRNPSSDLHKSLKQITLKSRTFWGITATTISRNIENLYNIVNLVYPWYLGTWPRFRDAYCNTTEKTISYDRINHKKNKVIQVTGIKNEEELRQKLAPILITGSSFLQAKYHFIKYNNSPEESTIYRKIARGIGVEPDIDPSEWFQRVMNDEFKSGRLLGEVERYSSRFLYLQYAADGIIAPDTTFTNDSSVKLSGLLTLVNEISSKGQSALIYFDYLATLEVVHKLLSKIPSVNVLLSTGEDKLKEGILTEARCKQKPHIVLCTRAASESVSYYFINNVIFFHIPTVPSVFTQFLGRITRKNTLYPDDLNCYIFTSDNIDLYKLLVVSSKTKLMEISSGEHEANVPDDYKDALDKNDAQTTYKRVLLWK